MTQKLNNTCSLKVSSRDKSNRVGVALKRLPTLTSAFAADAKAAKEKYDRTEFVRHSTKNIDKTPAGSTRKVTEKPFLHLADSEPSKQGREQNSAGPLSFKLADLGRRNERKGVTLNLQDGTGGPNNRKGALGNDEPGATINNGVTNGTLDKQGNPSSRPSFGVDSRRATMPTLRDMGSTCWKWGDYGQSVGGWIGSGIGGAAGGVAGSVGGPAGTIAGGVSGAWKGHAAGTIVGGLLGCVGSLMVKVVVDEYSDKTEDKTEDKKAEEKKEEDKKAEEKKEEDKKTDNNEDSQDPTLNPDELVCEDPEPQDQEDNESEKDATTTPKPDEDSSKGSPNVSFGEMSELATSGRGSLQDPGSDEDMPTSMNDAAIIDPFGRVKAKRDTQSYPTGEAKGAGNMQLPTGSAWDSLIQPVDPDGNTPSPTNPSNRL